MFKVRLLTPGPTPVPEETLLDLARPVHYHRSAEAKKTLSEVLQGLKVIFQTQYDVVPLTCSGTGAVEAAQVNLVPAGKKAICVHAGRFGERWVKIWQQFGVEVISVAAPWGQAVQPDQLQQAMKAHPDVQAVLAVHSETSTGVKHDIEAMGRLVAATDAVFIVDAISSAGAMECRTDAWRIDLLCTGSQKALMAPPGLAFVTISPKALAKMEAHRQPRTYYFDLCRARQKALESDTPFTPAHTLIRALKVSLDRLLAEGIENVWRRHRRVANATRSGLQAMGLTNYAHPPAETLTTVNVPQGIDGSQLLSRLEKQFGLKVAGGQDQLKGKIIRLAHMGYIDFFDILSALAGLEHVLRDMGHRCEWGCGLAAAQESFTRFSE